MTTRQVNLTRYNRSTSGIVDGQTGYAAHQINNYTPIETALDETQPYVEAHEKSMAGIERRSFIRQFDDDQVTTGTNSITINGGSWLVLCEVDNSGLVTERTGWANSGNIDVTGITNGVIWAIYPGFTYQATNNLPSSKPANAYRLLTFTNNAGVVTVNRKSWQNSVDSDNHSWEGSHAFSQPVSLSSGLSGAGGGEVNNYSLSASVATNALTVNLRNFAGVAPSSGSPVNLNFRSSTLATGQRVPRQVTSALSVAIPAGTTIGSINNDNRYIHVYAIDNAGTVELAVSLNGFVETNNLVSTSAISGGTSAHVLYSTTARSNVPVIYLGFLLAPQTTAGTWASAPSLVSASGQNLNRKILINESIIASPVAQVDFTTGFSNRFSTYILEWERLIPATNQVQLLLRVSANSGVSYDAGASDYRFSNIIAGITDAQSVASSLVLAGGHSLASGNVGNAAAAGTSGFCTIFNPANNTTRTTMIVESTWLDSSLSCQSARIGGGREATQATNAIRVLFSSGNIASGILRLYGELK